VARIAAALNDPDRSRIGDPREGKYAVRFVAETVQEALELAKLLAPFGLAVRIACECDETGLPHTITVNLYDADDQRRLLNAVEGELVAERRQVLEDLVLARGPIPGDILSRMREVHGDGWSYAQIAERMNERAIIAGMGGVHWTAQKVKKALAGTEVE
jgi:hypothetical protein